MSSWLYEIFLYQYIILTRKEILYLHEKQIYWVFFKFTRVKTRSYTGGIAESISNHAGMIPFLFANHVMLIDMIPSIPVFFENIFWDIFRRNLVFEKMRYFISYTSTVMYSFQAEIIFITHWTLTEKCWKTVFLKSWYDRYSFFQYKNYWLF